MLPFLLATSALPAAPPAMQHVELRPAPVLAPAPWQRRWATTGGGAPSWSQSWSQSWDHGPDGPDDVPEDGYGFKASKKDNKGFLWAGMSALAVGGITAASARSQSFAMREAQTLSELDAAYAKQRKLAYTSYGFLGAGALCMILEIPF